MGYTPAERTEIAQNAILSVIHTLIEGMEKRVEFEGSGASTIEERRRIIAETKVQGDEVAALFGYGRDVLPWNNSGETVRLETKL